MAVTKVFLLVAASVALTAAQPVDNLPVLIELQPEMLFTAGQSLYIQCATTKPGYDKIKYSWQKDGKPFDFKSRGDDGSLVLESPDVSAEGLYQCFATSEEGVASTRVVSVKRAFIDVPKYTLQKHKPVEGRPFKLDCSVDKAYPQPKIEWFRQGKDGKYLDIKEKRLLESPEGTLYFTNITKEDVDKELKYVCLAELPGSRPEDRVVAAEHIIEDMTLTKEPKDGELTPQYLSKDIVGRTGNVTMLYCIYGGTPMAHPDWFKLSPDGTRTNVNGKGGDRVTHRNRSAGRRLLIRDTVPEDQATYECVADNGVGKPKSHQIKLTVEQTAVFVKKPEPVLLAKEGQDVTLPCEVAGADQLVWTFNGKPLPGKTTKTLTLPKVQKKDNGYYGCKGTNKLGEVYAETLVHVA